MQLELNNLRKTYLLPAPLLHRRGQGKPKTKQALAGVSLTLGPGLYGLLGPNGAGKSTLIGIITGGLAADSGEVLWCGHPAHGIAFRRVLGYMPQQQGLYDSYTGRRFLAYMAALKEIPRAAVPGEVARVAAAVNLTDELDKRLAAYSGGMKQRLLLAAALLGDPKLLILDEPTAGLDPKERVRLRTLLAGMAQDRIILVATHVVSDVESVATKVILLRAGKIVDAAPVPELIANLRPGQWTGGRVSERVRRGGRQMSLFLAELRKVWGNRLFPLLLAVLAAANLLLLWMGTRPTAGQPSAAAYRAVGAQLDGLTMEEKGAYLHGKYTEIESLVKIGGFYRDMAYAGSSYLQAYRDENAAMFDAYEQEYKDKSYTLFTDDLNTEYRLFNQLQNEYDTVAAYTDFLDGVQTKATQLAGISIFQNDKTGYDLKNIEATAKVYAGLTATEIDYYPQKGLYTAISYAFTDLILLAAMLLLALLLVRQERDSGLLGLVRSLPGGRLQTALAKLAAFGVSLLVVVGAFVRRESRLLRCELRFGPADAHDSERAGPDALHDADHGRAVSAAVFAGQVGRGVRDGPLGHVGGADGAPRRRGLDRRVGAAVGDVRRARGYSGHEPFERNQIRKPRQPAANQRAARQLSQPVLVWHTDRAAAGRVDGGGVLRSAVRCGVLHGIRPRTAAARRQARPCVGADAQDESDLYYKGRGPQAVCAERRSSVPGSVLGVRRVSGRDKRKLY